MVPLHPTSPRWATPVTWDGGVGTGSKANLCVPYGILTAVVDELHLSRLSWIDRGLLYPISRVPVVRSLEHR